MLSDKIKSLLLDQLNVEKLDIIDESYRHQNHAQSNGGHFKVLIISKDFEGKTPVQRHRLVYSVLDTMIKNEIHALSISARTPSEGILNS